MRYGCHRRYSATPHKFNIRPLNSDKLGFLFYQSLEVKSRLPELVLQSQAA